MLKSPTSNPAARVGRHTSKTFLPPRVTVPINHGATAHSLLKAQTVHGAKPSPPYVSSRLAGVRAAVATPGPANTLQVLPPWIRRNAEKYRFITSSGIMVYVAVQPEGDEYLLVVNIAKDQLPKGVTPVLHWGMYRSSPSWYHPSEVIPPNSSKDDVTGATRSPFSFDGDRKSWVLEFRLPRRLAPVQLGFVLWFPETQSFAGSSAGRHFAVPIGLSPGSPSPLGPSIVSVNNPGDNGDPVRATVNFAVFSRHASAMSLCLMRRDGSTYLEMILDPAAHRTGDVWHVAVTGLKDLHTLVYGFRANGPGTWAEGGCFHPAFIMSDPYCPLVLPVTLPQAAYDSAPLIPPEGSVKEQVLLGGLGAFLQDFDWRGVGRPRRALEELLIMEVDVEAAGGGTYRGLLSRVPEIAASGISAVLLSNVFLSATRPPPLPPPATPPIEGAPPTPWDAVAAEAAEAAAAGGGWAGAPHVRRPLNYFAPEVRFVCPDDDAADAAHQLKEVIRAFHEAGVEVLLEAEFSVTSEAAGGIGGRLQSMAGLDGDMYLRGGGGPGASGVLNTGQPLVRSLVLSALRWWVEHYQVDGFCFVNAENLTQDPHGIVQDSPPLVEDLAADPLLRQVKLIAASANDGLLPRSGVRGFPHYGVLMEWNNRFGADAMAWIRDNAFGLASRLATRITGSADLFAPQWDADLPGGLAAGRRPGFSINALQPPLSPSLAEVAGDAVTARSLLLLMMVAQGTPAFNALTWSTPGLPDFMRGLITIRHKYKALLSPPLYDSPRSIKWHGAAPGSEPDWNGEGGVIPGSNYMAFSVVGAKGSGVYVGFNPYPEPCDVTLPSPGIGKQWRRLVDTSRPSPEDVVPAGAELLESHYILNPKAALMLEAVPRPAVGAGRPPPAAAAGRGSTAASYYNRMGQ